jgi:FG-GAP repeat protein
LRSVRGAPLVIVSLVAAARTPAAASIRDAVSVHEAQLMHHTDPIGQPFGGFGRSVAVMGDTAVVGAPGDGLDDLVTGAAYVFVRSAGTWTLQQTLAAGPTEDAIDFGSSVSISGDTVVVGAPREDGASGADTGAVYVFVRSGAVWTEQQKLVAADEPAGDLFGISLAVSGDTVLVGAQGDGSAAGAAHVFVRAGTSWTEQQKLVPSDGAAGDSFGAAVSLDGDIAVIGAYGDDTAAGANAGSAWVFARAGSIWSEQQELLASDAAADDGFGSAVSISDDTAVVGAALDDNALGADSGAAYVFVRSGAVWAEQQKLLASDGGAADQLGSAVSVFGDTVALGASGADGPAADAGAAYVFVRAAGVWSEQQKVAGRDPADGDQLGFAVAVSADILFAGAPLADAPGGLDAGRAYAFVRSGTLWTQEAGLLGADRPNLDSFGLAVSLAGDTAAVGVPIDATVGGTGAGSVYVFARSGSTWTEQQKLLAADGAQQDYLGTSVAIDGDTLAAGADADDGPGGVNSGSVYVFVRSGSTWTQQQKLVAPDAAVGDGFGGSLALSGDTLIVGAPGDDTAAGVDAGSAWVFVRTGASWTARQTLTASDGAPFDAFGSRVSVSGDTAVVGASFDDTAGGANAGSAYVFARSGGTWAEQQHLLAPDAAPDDGFGKSVSVAGDIAVIGAFGDDTAAGTDAGSAYVFVRSGTVWSQRQKLTASDAAANQWFGFSASAGADAITIGAPFADSPGGVTGAAYQYVLSGTTWSEQRKLWAPDGALGDSFGWAVSQSGDTAVVGAVQDDTPVGLWPGSAHVFRGMVPVELQSFTVE